MKYGKIICDPKSEEAKRLVGKKVLASDYHVSLNVAYDKFCEVGTLVYIDLDVPYPFKLMSENAYHYIREVIEPEKKYVPYDLSNPAVRKKLRGRWFFDKVVNCEASVNYFSCTDGEWKIVGNTAEEFLENCIWSDCTPCGEEVVE